MPSPVARLLPVASRRALWVGGKKAPKETQQRRSVARCEELRRNELRLRRFFSRQIHEAVTTRLISFHSANGFSRFARCCSGEAGFPGTTRFCCRAACPENEWCRWGSSRNWSKFHFWFHFWFCKLLSPFGRFWCKTWLAAACRITSSVAAVGELAR